MDLKITIKIFKQKADNGKHRLSQTKYEAMCIFNSDDVYKINLLLNVHFVRR